MRQLLCILLAGCFVVQGCGGREAHPILVRQPGDMQMSCELLQNEISQMDADIRAKIPKSSKTAKNVALGATGVLFIVPWFFMDLKNADKTELGAMQDRYKWLNRLAIEKKCDCGVENSGK